ncbi:hypothetical protein [Streptacidiphilus sp. PAMC 29251]
MSIPATPSPSGAPDPFNALTIEPDLVQALIAQGKHGERALNLLRDAAKILSEPQTFSAPYEVAQTCCRGAVDSILNIAGQNFPGLFSARLEVAARAKALVDAPDLEVGAPLELGALTQAVQVLREEESNRGGFRVRQVGALVRKHTQREIGAPEPHRPRRGRPDRVRRPDVLHGRQSTAAR